MLMRLVSRLGLALVVALGVASLVFALIHLTPGDPVEALLGERAQLALIVRRCARPWVWMHRCRHSGGVL